jgi:hypothetical protein
MFLLNSRNKECASENGKISKYVLHELQAICCSTAQYLMSGWVLSPPPPRLWGHRQDAENRLSSRFIIDSLRVVLGWWTAALRDHNVAGQLAWEFEFISSSCGPAYFHGRLTPQNVVQLGKLKHELSMGVLLWSPGPEMLSVCIEQIGEKRWEAPARLSVWPIERIELWEFSPSWNKDRIRK